MSKQYDNVEQHKTTSKLYNRIVIIRKYNIDENCSLCLNSMLNKKVYHLPCSHSYHINCFKQQVSIMRDMNTNCALCRKDFYYHMYPFPNLKEYIESVEYDYSTDDYSTDDYSTDDYSTDE